ncbi:MAG: hypothetical protein AAF160_21470 [Pseudomonadota bacterium]
MKMILGTRLRSAVRAGQGTTVADFPIWHVAAIVLFASPPFLAAALSAPHDTDSYYFNHAWVASFAAEISLANPYPRWLPALWDGAGGPDFYFYPPLTFYLTAVGVNGLGLSTDGAMIFAAWLLHIASGFGVWMLARSLGLHASSRLVAAAAVLCLPYHLDTFFVRGALGEVAAFAALGFLLSGVVDMLRHGRGGTRVVIATCATIFAHILAVALAALACGAVVLALRREIELARLARLVGALLLGALMAAAYWLPALTLFDTVSGDVLLAHHWWSHMARWEALSATPLLTGLYAPALLLTLVVLVVSWAARKTSPLASGFVVAAVVACWFMMTPISKALWMHTPLDVMQFPWRFLVVLEIAAAIGIGLGAEQAARRWTAWRHLLWGAVPITLLVMAVVQVTLDAEARRFGEQRPLATWALDKKIGPIEWLSTNGAGTAFTLRDLAEWGDVLQPLDATPTLWTDTKDAAILPISVAPREIVFRASSAEGMTVSFRRGFWSFWRLERVDGSAVVPLDATAPHPLLTARLPAGDAVWRLWLTPPIFAVAGYITSAAAVLVGLMLILTPLLRRRGVAGRSRAGAS